MHPTPHELLVDACEGAAREVFALMNRAAGPELLSLDLSMGQFKALMTITTAGPQPIGELGRRLGISEPAASLLADKLEDRGLARRERDANDRRRQLVTPTEEALELSARVRRGREDNIQQLFAAMSDDDLKALTQGFRSLVRVAETKVASATSTDETNQDESLKEEVSHG